MNGGYINITSQKSSSLYANKNFTFNGGEIIAKALTPNYNETTLKVGGNITISDECFIKTPDNGKIGTIDNFFKCKEFPIFTQV